MVAAFDMTPDHIRGIYIVMNPGKLSNSRKEIIGMNKPSIGVIFHPSFPPTLLVDYARRAEAAGFDELWFWDDAFWAGALTSAAVVLATTERLRVGIGILPVTARNPLFTAMELTTLACLYPGRIVPGFGHGVASWMTQIGAAPHSSLTALEETVNVIRGLLRGELVSFEGREVKMDGVQMQRTPPQAPPLLIGAMREKTMQLAGRVGDGVILTEMSSPDYVRYARTQMAHADKQVVVYVQARVDADGQAARQVIRPGLLEGLGWAEPQLRAAGLYEESRLLLQHEPSEAARMIPDAWLSLLTASGTSEQAAKAIMALPDAGATSIVLQPQSGSPECLDGYIRYLMPVLKA
jgi:alkanesulfonate monooxygenase SsuD/methylene tetrahydromethanopterin reductase-like flavin-dependent oxidoreductase (luciferase family)